MLPSTWAVQPLAAPCALAAPSTHGRVHLSKLRAPAFAHPPGARQHRALQGGEAAAQNPGRPAHQTPDSAYPSAAPGPHSLDGYQNPSSHPVQNFPSPPHQLPATAARLKPIQVRFSAKLCINSRAQWSAPTQNPQGAAQQAPHGARPCAPRSSPTRSAMQRHYEHSTAGRAGAKRAARLRAPSAACDARAGVTRPASTLSVKQGEMR